MSLSSKNIEVIFHQDPGSMALNVYVVKKDEYRRYIGRVISNGVLDFEFIKEGEETAPTMRVPFYIADAFKQGLAESLDGQGIKTDNDAKLSGILQATKHHLEDMRKLTFQDL